MKKSQFKVSKIMKMKSNLYENSNNKINDLSILKYANEKIIATKKDNNRI